MRRLLTIAALVAALPLAATADTCIGTNIDRFENGGPRMGELLVDENPPVRVEIVGSYLWVQILDGEILSVEVPADAATFTACESGAVSFTFPEVPETGEDEPTVSPAPVTVNVIDFWESVRPGGVSPV